MVVKVINKCLDPFIIATTVMQYFLKALRDLLLLTQAYGQAFV